MNHFGYRGGALHAEKLAGADIARQYSTPFYLYSAAGLRENYQNFAEALQALPMHARIFYALKANSNQAIITLLRQCGCGADVVSGGEIKRALKAGISPQDMVFSGVGKSHDELNFALQQGILQFNVESLSELELLNALACQQGKVAEIALRVNPDVDAKTHSKISTGKSENKFGIGLAEAESIYHLAQGMQAVKAVAIAIHIGSQLLDLQPYEEAWSKIFILAEKLLAQGIDLQRLDLGGGLGISYDGKETIALADYTALVARIFAPLQAKAPHLSLMFEPGRLLVGNSGILITRILHIKEGAEKRFIVVDAAMNDFMRPTLYDGYHKIAPLAAFDESDMSACDIVGPVCESGDFFGKGQVLPLSIKAGDLLYIADVGAYGAVMSGTYNTRPLIAEVLVDGDQTALIRAPISEDSIIANDTLPAWLKA